MALTAKQEVFAQGIALHGLNQTDSYTKAYGAGKMTQDSISTRASKLAALSEVSARIVVLRDRATAAVVAKVAYTMADAMAAAKKAEELAHGEGQAGAAVAAVTLQAKLAGHLIERKEVRSGPLEDVDIQRLLAMKAQAEVDLARASEVAAFMGDATVTVDQPVRRAIG